MQVDCPNCGAQNFAAPSIRCYFCHVPLRVLATAIVAEPDELVHATLERAPVPVGIDGFLELASAILRADPSCQLLGNQVDGFDVMRDGQRVTLRLLPDDVRRWMTACPETGAHAGIKCVDDVVALIRERTAA